MAFKILLVDDNRSFLATIAPLISALEGAEVVGEAHDGLEALTMATVLVPDLLLLDIAMPRLNGLEVAQRMQSWMHKPRIVFLTMHQQDSYRLAAQELGAEGCYDKGEFFTDVLPRVERMVEHASMPVTIGATLTGGLTRGTT